MLFFIGSLLLSACSDNETINQQDLEKAQEQKTEQSINKKYTNLSNLPTQFSDQNAQKAADRAIETYNKNLKQIEQEFTKHIQSTKESIESNLMSLKETLKQENLVYQDKCSQIKEDNKKQCNSFKKSLIDLKNKIKSVETKLINSEKELITEKKI